MSAAPIALFTYNRPDHLRQTLEALSRNDMARESALYVFSDGPKGESREQVRAVRGQLRNISGFHSVSVTERPENSGLAKSIITGVGEVVERHGRIIVLEDDMITSPHFLTYMNGALDLYADEERVISITAYTYPVQGELPPSFFLQGADCWGWGTWKRGWSLFESDGRKLLDPLRQRALTHAFDMDGSYPYTRMLKKQIAGKNDSWAIRWYASAFLAGKLTLYPGLSLLRNIGNDGAGTHSLKTDQYDVIPAASPVVLEKLAPEENRQARKRVAEYFRSIRGGIFRRILYQIRRLFGGKT